MPDYNDRLCRLEKQMEDLRIANKTMIHRYEDIIKEIKSYVFKIFLGISINFIAVVGVGGVALFFTVLNK